MEVVADELCSWGALFHGNAWHTSHKRRVLHWRIRTCGRQSHGGRHYQRFNDTFTKYKVQSTAGTLNRAQRIYPTALKAAKCLCINGGRSRGARSQVVRHRGASTFLILAPNGMENATVSQAWKHPFQPGSTRTPLQNPCLKLVQNNSRWQSQVML